MPLGSQGSEIEEIAGELRWPHITMPSPSKLGLLSQEKLRKTLRRHMGDVRIEDAQIPLAMVATDISSGEKVVMTEGDLAIGRLRQRLFSRDLHSRGAGRAASGGWWSGGEPSPISASKVGGGPDRGRGRLPGNDLPIGPTKLLDLIKNTVDIVLVQATRHEAVDADVLIAPDLQAFSSTELKDVPGLVEAGYRAAVEALDQVQA